MKTPPTVERHLHMCLPLPCPQLGESHNIDRSTRFWAAQMRWLPRLARLHREPAEHCVEPLLCLCLQQSEALLVLTIHSIAVLNMLSEFIELCHDLQRISCHARTQAEHEARCLEVMYLRKQIPDNLMDSGFLELTHTVGGFQNSFY